MARALSKDSLLQNRSFLNSIAKLYSASPDAVCQRYCALTEGLTGDIHFFSSPGRTELIGNHTDHNRGLVLAAAIDLDVAAALTLTGDDTITVRSEGYPSFSVNIDVSDAEPAEYGSSKALLKGVIRGFQNRGYKVGGFVMNAHSTIFKGAGVSSSAAFELLFCEVFNVLFNDGRLDFSEKAIIGQYAENVYFGKPSGLMDQLTISRGGVSYMDFDGDIPRSEGATWRLNGITAVIINCGGDHCNLTDEYTAIRSEMNEVASFFGKRVLRDVDYADFKGALPRLKEAVSGRAILRAYHFFEENLRVQVAYNALSTGRAEEFLQLVNASGISSYTLLQNCYPSADRVQSVPLALCVARYNPATLACRVHGGGFAGTVLCFVKTVDAKGYVNSMAELFGTENVFSLSIRDYGAIKLEA